MVDNETGRLVHVQTSSARLRERYRAAALARHEGIRSSIRGAGASHVVLWTDRDWVVDIARFLSEGRRRRAVRSPGLRRSGPLQQMGSDGPVPESVR
jgi:hypothetical protein